MSIREVDLDSLDIDMVKDWNEMIPVVRTIFHTMNGEDQWYFHYDEVMKALLGCDFLEIKKSCRLFLVSYRKGEGEIGYA